MVIKLNKNKEVGEKILILNQQGKIVDSKKKNIINKLYKNEIIKKEFEEINEKLNVTNNKITTINSTTTSTISSQINTLKTTMNDTNNKLTILLY